MAKVGYLCLAAAVLIPLGHPSQDAEHKAKNRKSTDEIVTIL